MRGVGGEALRSLTGGLTFNAANFVITTKARHGVDINVGYSGSAGSGSGSGIRRSKRTNLFGAGAALLIKTFVPVCLALSLLLLFLQLPFLLQCGHLACTRFFIHSYMFSMAPQLILYLLCNPLQVSNNNNDGKTQQR